jgi:hypothetical protein
MHPFRAAVEAGDVDRAVALLDDDVVMHSPVVYKPYEGRGTVAVILGAIFQIAEEFRWVREIGAADAREHALLFAMRVGDREVEGAFVVVSDAAGRIVDITLMIRPMSGLSAAAEAMRVQLESGS